MTYYNRQCNDIIIIFYVLGFSLSVDYQEIKLSYRLMNYHNDLFSVIEKTVQYEKMQGR